MSKHLKHVLQGALAVVVAAAPLVAANPSAQHYIATHPWVAAYLPIAVGVYRALRKQFVTG